MEDDPTEYLYICKYVCVLAWFAYLCVFMLSVVLTKYLVMIVSARILFLS